MRKSCLFTEPYFEIPTAIFVHNDFGDYQNIESLKGKRVAILKDVFYAKELRYVELVEFAAQKELVQILSYPLKA